MVKRMCVCVYACIYKEIHINLKSAQSNAVVEENRHGAIKKEFSSKMPDNFYYFSLLS